MLDSTAKLNDIITVLRKIEGINQRADLKSALVAKGINVLDTDGIADLISKLNSANLVLNGKKVASGNNYISTSTKTFSGTGGYSLYYLNITNLTFAPSFIYFRQSLSSANPAFTIYRATWGQFIYCTTNASQPIQTIGTLDGISYVNSTGFLLPFSTGGYYVDWVAFE